MLMLWVEYYEKLPIIVAACDPTVNDIKAEIEEAIGIPVENQQLYHSNILLQNEMSIDNYHIQPQDELVLYSMRSFTIAYKTSTYTVDISDENSVGDLIELAGKQVGVPASSLTLYWEEQLEEEKRIRDYKIPKNGAIIILMMKMGIVIEGRKGQYFVEVCELTTVAALKQILQDTFGLNKRGIQLISPNSFGYLSDDDNISDWGIDGRDNDKLLLIGD